MRQDPFPKGALARRELGRAGGVAGTRYLAERLGAALGRDVPIREIRDLFRHYGGGVRKLGAGYYALRDAVSPPVAAWVESELAGGVRVTVADLVDRVLRAYPHGDSYAVTAWVYQEPGRLRVTKGHVRIGRRRTRYGTVAR